MLIHFFTGEKCLVEVHELNPAWNPIEAQFLISLQVHFSSVH
jgi:hypothetical protein